MTQYNITSKAAIAIYRENRRYVVNKMTGPFWRQAIWIDVVNRNNVQWSHVEYFLNTFSDALQYESKEIDILYDDFIDSKNLSISELADTAWTC